MVWKSVLKSWDQFVCQVCWAYETFTNKSNNYSLNWYFFQDFWYCKIKPVTNKNPKPKNHLHYSSEFWVSQIVAGCDCVHQVTISSRGGCPASDIRQWSPWLLVTVGQAPWALSHSRENLPSEPDSCRNYWNKVTKCCLCHRNSSDGDIVHFNFSVDVNVPSM